MKNLKHLIILLTLLELLISNSVNGQSISVSSFIEHTIVSPKIGVSLGYIIEYDIEDCNRQMKIEVGGYYQKNYAEFKDKGKQLQNEKSNVGLYLESTFLQFHKLEFDFNIRAGIQNSDNLLIMPSIKSEVQIVKRLKIGASIGLRNNITPSIIYSVKILL
jgi:hypothetical protein